MAAARRARERIAYVDVDVHHGDGVQAIFYDDPRVLTISIHEFARSLLPRHRRVDGARRRERRGSAVNVPLPPVTGDDAWLDGVPRDRAAARCGRSRPDVLVTQLGCDTHATDPLAHMRLTTRRLPRDRGGAARAGARGRRGPLVATGGGGYQWARVVPRAWTIVLRRDGRAPSSPDALPEAWIEQAELELGGEVPGDVLGAAARTRPG